ncbi:hypothetical protein B9Z19DRAFT_563388 [Tuber borchii]|uniref:Uncharacterized protein n=1 Tax=Tuber borchii TaxID=42251 RepID=A0A2T7A8M8_TUBBO|nr:hypothetical protein B9Z19DRAFT_563388 [Tuber borchii]
MPYFWKDFLFLFFFTPCMPFLSLFLDLSFFYFFTFFLLFQSCSAFGCVWGSVICIFFFLLPCREGKEEGSSCGTIHRLHD